VSDETHEDGRPSWVTALGISDAPSGREIATAAGQRLIDAGEAGLTAPSDYTTGHIVFSGLLARAQGLHEASLSATDAETRTRHSRCCARTPRTPLRSFT
jgi:hypothetical protein